MERESTCVDVDSFTSALAAAGIPCSDPIQANGELQRFKSNCDKGANSWYVLFADGPVLAGTFGCWKRGIKETWNSNGAVNLSDAERRERRLRTEKLIAHRDTELAKRRDEAAVRVQKIWDDSEPACPSHPYLIRKAIGAHGLKQTVGTNGSRLLLIPLMDGQRLRSMQRIDDSGIKTFASGGEVSGCFHLIGEPKDTLCVAEGYATGAALHESTGLPVAVAFTCGNLAAVSKKLRTRYPNAKMILCSDDDYQTEGNPGLSKATAAAISIDGLLAVPVFKSRQDGDSDFCDLLSAEGAEAVKECIESAAAPQLTDEQELDRLAVLAPLEYDRVRDAASKRLGVRVAVLDDAVKKRRPETDERKQGHALNLKEYEPWPETVNGDDLLCELATMLTEFVVLPKRAADAIALWALHAFAFDAWDISPRLAITSPEKRCGKTTLLRILTNLVPRPLRSSSISVAALFRVIEDRQPTLLIDEADSFMGQNEELRGILNESHSKGGCVTRTVGEDHEPRTFRVFAPIAIAYIGKTWSTVEDRSIIIELQRRTKGQEVRRFRERHERERLEVLARKMVRFAQDCLDSLSAADPVVPDALDDRAADNWRPLFAIADQVGDDWPQKARDCALLLSGSREDDSKGVTLLTDIKGILGDTDRITSADLCEKLVGLEEAPWADWRKGKPITKEQLARMLKPFGIRSKTIRTATGTAKGYESEAFAESFARYIPPQPVTPSQTQPTNGDDTQQTAAIVTPPIDF